MDLSIRDVARLLKVSERTIYRSVRERHLPAIRVQDQYRFSAAEVQDRAAAEHLALPPELFAVVAHARTPSLRAADRVSELPAASAEPEAGKKSSKMWPLDPREVRCP
jgi:excisionase family DNA binding protein